jgi:hypothetical protein
MTERKNGHWSKSLQREAELIYAWETVKGCIPRINSKTAVNTLVGVGSVLSFSGCAEVNSQRTALATETVSPRPSDTFTITPPPTLTEIPTVTETPTVTPSPTESCMINGTVFAETNRHPDGGYIYPVEMSKIDKPLNQWTPEEETQIVDAAGNPIYDGVKAIADSPWVADNKLDYVATWVGKGCGYGLLFEDREGQPVWATDDRDRAMGRPDGNGLGAGVQEIPDPPVDGQTELIVGKDQTLVLVRNTDQIIGRYDPVTQKWEIFTGFEATATPKPEVINYPGITDPIGWRDAVDLSAEDCDQDLIYEYAENPDAGDRGGIVYFVDLMKKAFNIEFGPPPGYQIPPDVQNFRGMRHPDNTCWILWVKYQNEQYLVYPNNDEQTVIIPVNGGPGLP